MAVESHNAKVHNKQVHASWIRLTGTLGGGRNQTPQEVCPLYDSVPVKFPNGGIVWEGA